MKHFIVIAFLLTAAPVYSQNFDEWVRQKRTQIKYLVNQIAALQVYIELGQKGYAIYQDGLDFISDIKDGEFSLHREYFASLSAVKPGIANLPKVKEIIEWARQIRRFDELVGRLDLGREQSSAEKLFTGLVQRSSESIEQIELLVTDGNYQLNDRERIKRINDVYEQMSEVYGFARSLYNDALQLRGLQATDEKDVRLLRMFNGLD